MAEQDLNLSVPSEDVAAAERKAKRKRLFLIFGAVVVVAALLFAAWQLLFAWRSVSTDNAYVGADVAQVTPLVPGQVTAVKVADTQKVNAGDVLVQLDDADARMTLARAEADLAAAERRFRQTSSTGDSQTAQADASQAAILAAQARLKVAQANFDRARIDYDRRSKLSATGAVSGDELTSATNAYQSASANLSLAKADVVQAQASANAAHQQAQATIALVAGTNVATSPEVLAAKAARDQAKLDLERTVIRAPLSGVVTRRQVQVGQRVATGAVMMTIVPIDKLFVDANFKEGQLGRVRAGQPAEMTSDLFGSGVVYHGKVVGLAGGTGAAFALIPAQNATGNWIKVVQRLPVRITLDPKDLAAHPLRVGLSMTATVDVSR